MRQDWLFGRLVVLFVCGIITCCSWYCAAFPTTSRLTATTTITKFCFGKEEYQHDNDSTSTTTAVWTSPSPHMYEVIERYEMIDGLPPVPLWEALMYHNPRRFISKSQAKKACHFGHVVVINNEYSSSSLSDATTSTSSKVKEYPKEDAVDVAMDIGAEGKGYDPFEMVLAGDTIVLRTRKPNAYYPVSVTKYVEPPPPLTMKTTSLDDNNTVVIYENDHLAVVKKPENMTTIAGGDIRRHEDRSFCLQSHLGFLLHPSPLEPDYHPRPVHRLDRRTSGLVLVAKTKESMRSLSKAFADRRVTKTYTALVGVGIGNDDSDTDAEWKTIDYPIDGRAAVSEYKWLSPSSSSSSSLGPNSRQENDNDFDENGTDNDSNNGHNFWLQWVQVRPHTGRTHQIRRHLAYCLNSPIVGDAKYDKGAKHLRTDGMYLCCHELEFPLPSPLRGQNKKQKGQQASGGEENNQVGLLLVQNDGNECFAECGGHVVKLITSLEGNAVDDDGGGIDQKSLCRLRVSIPLPAKFESRLQQQQQEGIE